MLSHESAPLLTDVSREARTSLDVILGYTGILREDSCADGQFGAELDHIEQAANQLVYQIQALEAMVEREHWRREAVEALRGLHRSLGSRAQLIEGILSAVERLTRASSLELILPEERQSFCYAEGVLQSSRAERVANSEYQKISLKSQHAGILWIAGGNQKQLQTIQNILAEEIGLILDNAWLFSHTRKLADTDPLTGVMNRRAFLSKAQELVAGLKEGERLSVAVLDVDHFKKVNDTWGHGAGDEVLCAVARRCANVLRQQDVFGRLGGEEFALVMTQSEGQESACSAAERIRVAVGNTGITTSQGLIPVTVSIGVASGQGLELLGLIEQADSALYMAKRSGRNKVCQAQEPI